MWVYLDFWMKKAAVSVLNKLAKSVLFLNAMKVELSSFWSLLICSTLVSNQTLMLAIKKKNKDKYGFFGLKQEKWSHNWQMLSSNITWICKMIITSGAQEEIYRVILWWSYLYLCFFFSFLLALHTFSSYFFEGKWEWLSSGRLTTLCQLFPILLFLFFTWQLKSVLF